MKSLIFLFCIDTVAATATATVAATTFAALAAIVIVCSVS